MRRLIGLLMVALLAAAGGAGAEEAAARYFKIATAGTSGTYFPIGGMIAGAISGPAGVPGLVATAVASTGSIANIEAISSGGVESGLAQADVARAALTGTGAFEVKGKRDNLRAIAALYPEAVHLVVRKASGIATLADLKGKHVSIDEPGSGVLVDVRLILAAHDLSERDFTAEYFKPDLAAQMVANGQLDGLFFVGGYPSAAIQALAARPDAEVALVPIAGPAVKRLLAENPFFTVTSIPVNVYAGLGPVETVGVRALWLTSAEQPDDLIEAITAALWSEQARPILDGGHPQGHAIQPATALEGLTVPLHPGAERYYRKAGLIK